MSDFFTVKEIAEKHNVSERAVRKWIASNKISNALKLGNTWVIQKNYEIIPDRRYKENKKAEH